MSHDFKVKYDIERYRPLGLLGNPFAMAENNKLFTVAETETAAEANRLLSALITSANEQSPRPIAVIKSDKIPAAYPLRAVGLVERSLATDESVNLLHAYVPLFMMRLGRVRSILSVVAERLAFRDFDATLVSYFDHVLASPDTTLASYQMLGEVELAEFAARFSAAPLETVRELFGEDELERHPELKDITDSRVDDLPSDVDEAEADPELDASVGDAPANVLLMAEAEEAEIEDPDRAVVDYLVEYAGAHFSPVLARSLRVYRDRGLIGLVNELKVTKAPKKTLLSLANFARLRFKKLVLIFDGFEGWYGVPTPLKAEIAATLSEVRWLLEREGILVFALEQDPVPELEEQFGHGTRIEWAFSSLQDLVEAKDELRLEDVNAWLAAACMPGSTALTADDAVLAALIGEASGFKEFCMRACVAIESAADRGISTLDDEALAEARAATMPAEETPA